MSDRREEFGNGLEFVKKNFHHKLFQKGERRTKMNKQNGFWKLVLNKKKNTKKTKIIEVKKGKISDGLWKRLFHNGRCMQRSVAVNGRMNWVLSGWMMSGWVGDE